ncbi:unnamed protein product [Mytilus coruscus]|uniref:Uncharacterized protein n=1 Tax=Mytilus coruscus TaxID=42192 RepID=A0A6J8AU29_MYTCO|nr:unnamed protein product [Mytilus coruscus]
MALETSQSCQKHTRKRPHNESDEDSDWEINSSRSNSKFQELTTIPYDTRTWKPHILDRLHISLDDAQKNPEELLNICATIPPFNEELKQVVDYISEKINIDLPFEQLKAMSLADLDSIGRELVDIKSHLQELATAGNYSQLKMNVHTHGQGFVEAVKKLIYFLSVEEASYESLFVPVLREFCKACSFLGCDGIKKELIIEGCPVAAFPDLEFQAVKIPFGSLQGYATVSTAELEECDDSRNDVQTRPNTRLNQEQGESVGSKFLPRDIKGAAQHAGQLLLEVKRSAFKPCSFGIMLIGSKIMLTCLEVSSYYLNHIGDRLREEDKGKLHYSDLFDIFKASDRKALVNAFLRLAQAQSVMT